MLQCTATDTFNPTFAVVFDRCNAGPSLVFSHLDYCNAVFAALPHCQIQRLQSVQNAAVRLVAGAMKYDHVTPLLRDQHWLPVARRVDYKLCMLVYRCLHNTAPEYLQECIKLLSDTQSRYALRSSDTFTVCVPRTHSALGGRAFAVAGPRAWNNLPAEVQCAPSLNTFKKLLKTHFFRAAYS